MTTVKAHSRTVKGKGTESKVRRHYRYVRQKRSLDTLINWRGLKEQGEALFGKKNKKALSKNEAGEYATYLRSRKARKSMKARNAKYKF